MSDTLNRADLVDAAFVVRMSMPRVFRSEIEAINPRRESSAATKYSPATPASSDVVFDLVAFGLADTGHIVLI